MVYIGSVGNYNLRFFAGESLQTLEATVQDIVCLFIYRETSRKSGTEGVYSERTRKEVIYQESVLSKLKIFLVEGNVLCKKQNAKKTGVSYVRCRGTFKCVPHVQHDYFSSFNQSFDRFMTLSLHLSLPLFKLLKRVNWPFRVEWKT